jgi:ketosteroid isomerase-like protein
MEPAQEVVDRVCRATNGHDIEALVGCFGPDYVNETPVHPARGFGGRDQVRRNWEQIFANVSDLRAEVVGRATDGDTAWTEWEMTGTRPDGSRHHMQGVIIFTVVDDLIRSARFYLEPVDDGADTADDAVHAQVVRR